METKSTDLLDKDEKYIWHSMRPYNPKATMVMREAKGAYVKNTDGKEFLDAMSGLWCVNSGYGRQDLAQAAYDQMMELSYFPMTHSHIPAIKLGEKLNKWLGEEYVIFFLNQWI